MTLLPGEGGVSPSLEEEFLIESTELKKLLVEEVVSLVSAVALLVVVPEPKNFSMVRSRRSDDILGA